MSRLRLGTRGSALARAQTNVVAGLLRDRLTALDVTIEVIDVSGDRPGAGFPAPDKSRWVDRIEDALQAGRIDLAVHSAKDVPAQLAPGLTLMGAPARVDPRDALCGAAGVAELPRGARVGTSSVRRAAQLRAAREDLEIQTLSGNVDTRLRRLGEGAYDAIVLAQAGLLRLDRVASSAAVALDAEQFVPAPGQGILALQGRRGDEQANAAAQAITDSATERALAAERALVSALGASCHTPVGAYARSVGAELALSAFVGLPDGSAWVRDRLCGSAHEPELLGRRVGERMLATGAGELLAQAEEMAREHA